VSGTNGTPRPDPGRRALAALERVTKWRGWFAGWQLGTRSMTDPECAAVRDHRETTILLRIESSALVALLIRKGVLTQDEWAEQLAVEADALSAGYSERFPGVEATEHGLAMDPAVVGETMRRHHFKP
jgi:hypothetical protein